MRPIHVVSAALVCAAGALAACNVVLGLDDLKDQVDSGTTEGGADDAGVDVDGGPNCAGYCTAIAVACTGSRKQYFNGETCMAMCGTYPVGASSQNANTLRCRLAYLANDCPSAGPYSPNCGGEAENFCLFYMRACVDGGGYGPNCPASFGGIANPPDAGSIATPPNSGNTRTCRELEIELAYRDDASYPGCELASKDAAAPGCSQ